MAIVDTRQATVVGVANGLGVALPKRAEARTRQQWESSMQVFGVDPGIEGTLRRKQAAKPRGVATLAAVRARAAQYSDIVDVAAKRRLPEPPSVKTQKPGKEVQAIDIDAQFRRRPLDARRRVAAGVVPTDATSYDAGTRLRRSFFDGAVHAERYAQLLGRPDAESTDADSCFEDPNYTCLPELELEVGGHLPLHVRRMVEALLPGKSDRAMQGMPKEVFARVRQQVQYMVTERYFSVAAAEPAPPVRTKRPSVVSSQSTSPELERPQHGQQDDSLLEDEIEYSIDSTLLSQEELAASTPGMDLAASPQRLQPPAPELPTLLSPTRARTSLLHDEKDGKKPDFQLDYQ